MQHTLSVLVENKSGVLAKISGLFSARGFNIQSLAVGETEDPTISKMTIVVGGDNKILEQVKKQLRKLIDVIKLKDLTKEGMIDKELVLCKIPVENRQNQIFQNLIKKYKTEILFPTKEYLIIETRVDSKDTIEFFKLLHQIEGFDITRTGKIAIAK
jgi:acetolactate synthase-1/3 small subunit